MTQRRFNRLVFPHILLRVALIRVDSVVAPIEQRLAAWRPFERELDKSKLRMMTTLEPISRLPQLAEGIVMGSAVIDIASVGRVLLGGLKVECQLFQECYDGLLVALVEDPLANPPAAQEAGSGECRKMSRDG